jgi:hypothetical protein
MIARKGQAQAAQSSAGDDFDRTQVYASAVKKWLPQKLLKQPMLQLLKEW